MGNLNRRLEHHSGGQPEGVIRRKVLSRLTDEELERLEEALLADARAGEQPPLTNELLEKMKRSEAEATEQQRRNAKKGATQ